MRLGAADVEADAPRPRPVRRSPRPPGLSQQLRHRGDARRGRAARADGREADVVRSTASPTRRRRPAGRPPRARAGRPAPRAVGRRRAPARRGVRRPGPRPAARPPATPGRGGGPAGRPHATSPTAMLADGVDADDDGAGEVGQVAVDPRRGGGRTGLSGASGSSGWVAVAGTRIAATRRGGLREPVVRSGGRRATAATIASRTSSTSAAGLSGPRHRRSHPAARARTAASGMPSTADAPAMSSASLTITPSKPSTSRSMPSTSGLRVAGRSGSSAGTTMCEVITAAVPASTAASKGTSSRAARVSASTSMRRQVEVAVGGGVAVAGEVLGAGRDTGRLEAARPGRDVRGDLLGVRRRSCGCR